MQSIQRYFADLSQRLGLVDELIRLSSTRTFEVGKRQLLPQQNAVRFLVKRKVAEERFEMGNISVTSTAHLRIAPAR